MNFKKGKITNFLWPFFVEQAFFLLLRFCFEKKITQARICVKGEQKWGLKNFIAKFLWNYFHEIFRENPFFPALTLVLAGHKNITISQEIYMCELCSTRALWRTLCVVRHIIHLQFSFYFKTRENAMHISSEGGTREDWSPSPPINFWFYTYIFRWKFIIPKFIIE